MKIKRITALVLSLLFVLNITPFALADGSDGWSREKYYEESLTRFSGFDTSDQNYITDEDFFGKWDGENWEKEPLFDYEAYPEMSQVEENAKTGDYPEAKKALLEYYKGRYKNFNISNSISKNVTDQQLAEYERGLDNFLIPTGGNAVIGRILLDEEDGWSSMTITEEIEACQYYNLQTRVFQFAASNKDGYTAEICSMEGENRPYIEALVNGSYRRYYPTRDSYIEVGKREESFGESEILKMEESVSSVGINPLRPVDAYTKTAFMEFDFSDLESTDVINEAKLYVYGKMVESDNPAGIPDERNWKSIYVFPYTAATVDINTLTYQSYKNASDPTYASFDLEPGRWFIENTETGEIDMSVNSLDSMIGRVNAESLVYGYQATDNEVFAYHALRTMLHEIKINGNQELRLKRDNSYNVGVAFRTAQACWSYAPYLHSLIKSEYMTPEVFTAIMKYMFDSGEILVKAWNQGEDKNNWGGYNCMGLQYMYFFFPEFKQAQAPLIEEPLKPEYPGSVQGGWKEVEIFRRQYKAFDDFYEDGTSVERSSQYAIEGFETLLSPLTVANMVGADPLEGYNEEMIEQLEKAVMYILSHLNPCFGDWGIGDSGSYTADFPKRLKPVLDLIKDNSTIEYVATKRTYGEKPDFLTVVNDTMSKATFRNSWEDTAVAAHFANSAGAGSHGHNDDLSLVLSAYGQYLLVDSRPGTYAVSEPKERWASSTRGHNTVEINDTIAKGSKYYHEGDVDYFGDTMIVPIRQYADREPGNMYPENREINSIYDFVRGESLGYTDHNRLDTGFKVMRDVMFLRDGYFIVTDYIEPEDPTPKNKYRQLWHFLPESNFSTDAATNTVQSNFDGSANLVIATVKKDSISAPQRKEGLYAATKKVFKETEYAFYQQDKEGIVTFNTLLYPLEVRQKADVVTTPLTLDIDDTKANAFRADVTDKSNGLTKTINYYTLFDESLAVNRKFGLFETDGKVALSEKTGDSFSMAILRDGTSLKDTLGDSYLIYSEEKVEDIGVQWDADSIYIAAENAEDIDFDKLTVLAENPVNTVFVNDVQIPFNSMGKYIYFGEEPVLEDDTVQEDDKEDSGPVHSSGGGGTTPKPDKTDEPQDPDPQIPAENTEKTPFDKELSGHWAEKEIRELLKKGIVNGVSETSLGLDRNITRAEFTALLVRAVNAQKQDSEIVFSDVRADSWYKDVVEIAASSGWVQGSEGKFYPDRIITREEMTKILVTVYEQQYGIIENDAVSDFTDKENISPWAEEYVRKAAFAKLVNGMEDGSFCPKNPALREQVMVIIYRLLNAEKPSTGMEQN